MFYEPYKSFSVDQTTSTLPLSLILPVFPQHEIQDFVDIHTDRSIVISYFSFARSVSCPSIQLFVCCAFNREGDRCAGAADSSFRFGFAFLLLL